MNFACLLSLVTPLRFFVTSGSGMSRPVFIASNPSPNASTSTRDTTAATIVELNGFFPIDLILINFHSRERIYQVWDEVKTARYEDEDTESDEDEDEDEDEDAEVYGNEAPSQDSARALIVVESISAAGGSVDDLNKSFGGMSISLMRQMVLPKSFIETAA